MTAQSTMLNLVHDPDFLNSPNAAQRAMMIEALRTLTPGEAGAVVKELLQALGEAEDADTLLGQVSASVPNALVPFHAELLRRRIFYPFWLYLGATQATAERLLQLSNYPRPGVDRRHTLSCLTWIDQPLVTDAFHAWQRRPPSWHLPEGTARLDEYPLDAGWEVTPEGLRRLLYLPHAYELVEQSGERVVAVIRRALTPGDHDSGERCGWCQRPLFTLLDLDLADPRLVGFAALAPHGEGQRLRIRTCEWCSTFTTLFTEVDFAGASHWSEANGAVPEILSQVGFGDPDDPLWPSSGLVLGEARRTPFETIDRDMYGGPGISQVGGHPEWVSNFDYPQCPRCQRWMVCLGQIAWAEVDASLEGTTYAWLCVTDHLAATTYQSS